MLDSISLRGFLQYAFSGSFNPDIYLRNCEALQIMLELNPRVFASEENGYAVFVEHNWDSKEDKRNYKLEYRSTFDGKKAVALCVYNPWGENGRPNAGVSASRGHVFDNGFLCLSGNHTTEVSESELNLETVVMRSRYWCTGFSYFKETGEFPNL